MMDAASHLPAAAAVPPGRVRVSGVHSTTLPGDCRPRPTAAFNLTLLRRMEDSASVIGLLAEAASRDDRASGRVWALRGFSVAVAGLSRNLTLWSGLGRFGLAVTATADVHGSTSGVSGELWRCKRRRIGTAENVTAALSLATRPGAMRSLTAAPNNARPAYRRGCASWKASCTELPQGPPSLAPVGDASHASSVTDAVKLHTFNRMLTILIMAQQRCLPLYRAADPSTRWSLPRAITRVARLILQLHNALVGSPQSPQMRPLKVVQEALAAAIAINAELAGQ
eukprot:GHVT01028493.1.p1 GENE.GHVT01028493.1~~GHVT01028493.1.p1  ORF type:complete len:283 (+),score=38.35 GHVT01028493.1:4255-5103(+)